MDFGAGQLGLAPEIPQICLANRRCRMNRKRTRRTIGKISLTPWRPHWAQFIVHIAKKLLQKKSYLKSHCSQKNWVDYFRELFAPKTIMVSTLKRLRFFAAQLFDWLMFVNYPNFRTAFSVSIWLVKIWEVVKKWNHWFLMIDYLITNITLSNGLNQIDSFTQFSPAFVEWLRWFCRNCNIRSTALNQFSSLVPDCEGALKSASQIHFEWTFSLALVWGWPYRS